MTLFVLAATRVAHDPAVSDYYLQNSAPKAYGRNVVNVILVDFRALDTLGEITVRRGGRARRLRPHAARRRPPAEGPVMRDSLILRTTTRLLLPLLVMFSLFILLRGHNEPGGGFIGGLLAAGGLCLYLLAHGADATRRLLRVDPRTLIGIGAGDRPRQRSACAPARPTPS